MPEPPPTNESAHQRASGTLALAFKRRGEATVLGGLRQEGCLKARFPRTAPPDWPGAVTLNCAGGVAGGDRLALAITAGPGTRATLSSQSAERIYRALPGQCAQVATILHAEAEASLEWLPQETILFDRCALSRRLDVHLAPTASALCLEMLVFGRTAMQEQVHEATLTDLVTLRQGGRLLLHDAIRLHGPVAPVLARPAIARAGRAVGTLLYAAPDAPALLAPLRDALAAQPQAESGATLLAPPPTPLLVARLVAPTGAMLRAAVVAGLNILRPGRTLPRTWLC